MKIKLTVTLKNERAIQMGKKIMILSILGLAKNIETIEKTEAICMSEQENLMKVKIKML